MCARLIEVVVSQRIPRVLLLLEKVYKFESLRYYINVLSPADIPFAPCCVRASNITSDSAVISWIPCNSNFYHVVAVNSVEVRTVKPSVFKHLITGLAANTLYRVSVRAKPGKLLCSDEKNPKKLEMLTTFVDFRTLPKSTHL